MSFCPNCGASVGPGVAFCPNCGKSTTQVTASAGPGPVAATPSSAMADNVAGMLAYITFIPAIIFLAMAPYNRSSFVRFHSFQCIFFSVALFVIHLVLGFIPVLGWALSLLVSLAALALWIVVLIKAYQGQKFKIPIIGDLAEKQAMAA